MQCHHVTGGLSPETTGVARTGVHSPLQTGVGGLLASWSWALEQWSLVGSALVLPHPPWDWEAFL